MPKRTDQLQPFEKGDTRINMKGRPKGSRNLKTLIKEQMQTVIQYQNPFTDEAEQMTPIDALTLNLWHRAIVKNDFQAQTLLMKYISEIEINETNDVSKESEEDLREHLRRLSNITWPDEYGFTFDAFILHLEEIQEVIGDDKNYLKH